MTSCGSVPRRWLATAIALTLLVALPALAQNPTGTLTGRVTDQDGGALPGVTVSATSPNLQGSRVAHTGPSGDYKLAFLPPGDYRVTYELEGFSAVAKEVKVSAAQTSSVDASLEIGVVSEEIVVTGQQGLISESGAGASTLTADEVGKLAIGRDVAETITLAPGVSDTGFGSSQSPSISGAMTFENLFLVNGVVINENIRGDVLPLFIEDAIQETTVSSSGISAEYGRFTGGVINAITKSGGNEFDGSLRVSYTNEDWESATALTTTQTDEVNEVYEGTLGGFLWKDHLWFFGAGRDRELVGSSATSVTSISYPTTDEETRLEGKLTLSPHPSHTVLGSYSEIDRVRAGTIFGTILDLRSVNAQREDPQEIQTVNYTGILSPNLFVEGQYSERQFVIGRGSGGVPDIIEGTLIRTRNESFRYWAPTFCGSCQDEKRDNENLLAKGSYFLSTEGLGSHDLVFGYDTFEDQRFAINHQTGSDFTVYGSSVLRDASGNVVLDPNFGSPIPVFDPSASAPPQVRWFAVYNLDLARPTAFATDSYYVNDRWQLNDRWSFSLGARYDENDGKNSAGATVADDSKVSPRLGASYDLRGDGDWVFHASYGSYVAALANSVADGSSNGGAIGDFLWDYAGPALNVGCTPGVDCLNAQQVLELVFDWYRSQGGVFDLGAVNPNAAINQHLVAIDVPGATTQVLDGIKSPSVDELTVGVAKRLGSRGLVRGDVVYREWDDFYGARTTLENGKVPTSSGPADLTFIGNFAPGIEREYLGLHTQFRYRLTDRLSTAVNYTLSETEGNFDGESGPSGPVNSTPLVYPEYRQESWNYPTGELRVDARHKVRAWAVYDLFEREHHALSVSWLESYTSGQPYAANATVNSRNFVTNPGYSTPPSSQTYFFTPRGAFHTDDIHSSDLSLNYAFRFKALGQDVEVFLSPEVINVFDEDGVFDPNGLDDNEGITVIQSFDPFTTTPVEGTHWRKANNFGQPLNELDFQTPRTYQFSVGFRF
jgi:hypothetical protein